MQYILRIGPWHIGPFTTHQAASHFAESHGCDDYIMIPMDDPAEARRSLNILAFAASDAQIAVVAAFLIVSNFGLTTHKQKFHLPNLHTWPDS